MAEAFGYAAVHGSKILVKTLSDTERAAMVNWLVTEGQTMVFSNEDDETIRSKFCRERDKRGGIREIAIRLVRISLVAPADSGGAT